MLYTLNYTFAWYSVRSITINAPKTQPLKNTYFPITVIKMQVITNASLKFRIHQGSI